MLGKLGEGSFGEAFKVREKTTGKFFAIKKAKERYLGFKDREQKLQEVYKAQKLAGNQYENDFYQGFCLKVHEAWEESGHLYIKSDLCEKGNLNDYLVERGLK
jgi:serine/threonine protein kinase